MSMVDALIGAEAGIVAIWCTIPLEKMQQKSATERDEHGKPKPYLRIAGEILREKGITAFWNGIDVLTVSVFFEKGMYYGFYSAITRVVNPTSLFSNLMCGYIAELCRVPFVYPIEMVASRMMTRGLTAGQSIKQLHSEGGMAQFWKGSELFLGLSLRSAITQAIFDQIRRYYLQTQPVGVILTFFQSLGLGAFASIIARTLTYPLFQATVKIKSGQVKGKGPVQVMLDVYKEGGIAGMFVGCGPELLRGVTFQAILEATREQITTPNRRFFGTLEA